MSTKKPSSRVSAVKKKTAPVETPAVKSKSPAKAAPKNGKAVATETEPSSAALLDGIPATDDVSRQAIRLAFLVHDVSRIRRAAYDQLMKPLNFTRARWWVLAHLSRHDGMMQSQLADVLEVGKASLGSVVEQLESDGWLERRSDPSDKRAKRVYLTRSAQPFIKKMTLEEDEFNKRILVNLNSVDRANLIRLLSLVKESLQQFAKSSDTE
ncbi:MAG: transcriptional regulator, MarR family [Hydrocarboniphaga sp.]|uniref:MarR family winged helix-turn-helix transcriptional regulator n=1 Tax=Hydrocarboniphaga sp. TaxID=2033016 RepID=UPI0026366A18|nr:MarR family transcriptional regulator [Hydrocarboniphaga sp.]MDB5971527.1 transcriptional regulator, MarR family [Hydrocarboniphaga sp.]